MPEFKNTYLLDTDVLGHIQDHPDSNRIYDEIIVGVVEGKVRTVRQVIGELRKFPEAYSKLFPFHTKFEIEASKQLCVQVSEIIDIIGNTAPGLYEQLGGKNPDPADPWLIAVAKVHGFTLVTDENPYSPKRIPMVCDHDGLKCHCISGPHFLVETGIIQDIRPEHISIRAFYDLDRQGRAD